jgi:hypothetical protein
MFDAITPQAIIDDANALTDNDGYSLISTAQFIAWMNNEISTAWQWGMRCNRDAFTSNKEGQITSPANYISITATAPTGLGVTDFLSVRGVDLKLGDQIYKKIRPWNFVTRDRLIMLSYRAIGENLWLMPPQYSSLYPFRLWYITKAPAAAVGSLSTALSLPTGVDEYVKQGMAAKVRIRLDEDPAPHLEAQAQARAGTEAWLQSAHGDQGTIADTSDDYWSEMW